MNTKPIITISGEMFNTLVAELGETPTIGDTISIELTTKCVGLNKHDEADEGGKKWPIVTISLEVESIEYAEMMEQGQDDEEETEETVAEMGEGEETEIPPTVKKNPALVKAHVAVIKSVKAKPAKNA